MVAHSKHALPIVALSLAALCSSALSGCVNQKGEPTASSSTSSAPRSASRSASQATSDPKNSGPKLSADSPIQKCDKLAPGQYATVEAKDADKSQLRQGRYPQGQYGGTLQRSIIGADPHTFNYWSAADSTSRELAGLMFAGLVDIDYFTGQITPALAATVEAQKDNRTYIVHLRRGLKWSDGKPLTAEDVAFTWNVIVKGGFGNSSLRDIAVGDGAPPAVTALDGQTIKFVTAAPLVSFIKALNLPIAPKHILAPVCQGSGAHDKFNQYWSSQAPPASFVVSGAFALESFAPGERIVFKRSKTYYGVAPDGKALPYLDKVVFTIVPDVNTNLLKFRAKELDITMLRPRDAGDLVSSAAHGNYKLYDFGPMISSNFLTFNLNQRKDPATGKAYVDPIKSAWFNDLNFRQAINHAIDRHSIVRNYLKGLGNETFCSQVSSSPFYDQALKPFPQDLPYARKLLSLSGFHLDKEGMLLDKVGHKVEFELLTATDSPYWSFFGSAFKEDMKKLGIKVDYGELNFNTLADKLSHSLDWQACLFSLSGGDPLDPNDSANVYLSDGRLHIFDQRLPNDKGKITALDARPWEKEIDALMKSGPRTFDFARRKAIYNQVDQIIYDQSPFIYTATGTYIVGARNTIQNYYPTPLSQQTLGLHNLDEVWLK